MATYTKETALYDTGAIANDIANAGTTATSYITRVDATNGIRVHDLNESTDFVQVNSSAISMYRGGTAAANEKVRIEDDEIRVGATTTGHAVLDEDGMDVYIGDTSVAHYGDYARVGKEGEANTRISPSEVSISAGNNINALRITSDGNIQTINKDVDIAKTIKTSQSYSYTHPSEATTGTILKYKVVSSEGKRKLFSVIKGTSVSSTTITVTNSFKFRYSATTTAVTVENLGTKDIRLEYVSFKVETTSPLTEVGGVLTVGQYPDVGSNTVFAVGNGTEGALSNALRVTSNGAINITGSSGYVEINGERVLPIPDTGWVTLTLSSGSGTLQYRCVGKIVYIVGTGLNVTHNTNFVTLPAAIRPTIRMTCSASFPVDKNIYVNLYANGQMAAIQNGGGSISNLFFTMSYPI